MSKTNYEDYGYKPTAKVEVTGAFFNQLSNFLLTLRNDETKVQYPLAKDGKEKDPQVFVTPLGYASNQFLDALEQFHHKNVDSGHATLRTELNKPQVELIKP